MTSAETILVVDDDAVSRHVLGEILANAGLRSVCLPSGRAALDWLASDVPLLLLLDLVMEPPNGYEVLAHVRSRLPLRMRFLAQLGHGS